MNKLIILATCAVAAGCTAQDAQVRSVLNSMCPSVDVAYAHYTAAASLVSARTRSRVELAKQQAEMLCAGRATATTVSTLAVGSAVYLTVRDALKEAKANGGSVAYSGDLRKLEGMMRRLK